jgi:hypothetical protein
MAAAAAFLRWRLKPNGGNAPQAWFRRSRKRSPKGNALSECHSLPAQTFPPPRKLDERIATACSTILRQEHYQADQKDRASVDRSHEAAVVLEPANRISAETPTSAPPMKQNICRQIAEGIASWVTPWTSA